ncbi:hypothetical protein Trydic_g8521 [Trypoxylus dichotomus]
MVATTDSLAKCKLGSLKKAEPAFAMKRDKDTSLPYQKTLIYELWVSKMLSDDHKVHRMGLALKFLIRYEVEDEDIWIQHCTPATKEVTTLKLAKQRM